MVYLCNGHFLRRPSFGHLMGVQTRFRAYIFMREAHNLWITRRLPYTVAAGIRQREAEGKSAAHLYPLWIRLKYHALAYADGLDRIGWLAPCERILARSSTSTMAQAKVVKRPAKKAPVEATCAFCGLTIEADETSVQGPNGVYHDMCLKSEQQEQGKTRSKTVAKRKTVVEEEVEEELDEEVDEDLEDEADEEDEEEDEDEIDETITASDEDEDEDADEDEADEEDEEEADEDEDEEEDEPAPARKPTASGKKKAVAVEEYEEEDEPAPRRAKASADGTVKKAPSKKPVEVKGLDDLGIVFTVNPARAGSKRWAVLEAMARVKQDGMGKGGAGTTDSLKKEANRLLARLRKANPGNDKIEESVGAINIPWFATDKGKADIFKNGASGWEILSNDENATYRIRKKPAAKR